MHQELIHTIRRQTIHNGARNRVKTLPRLAVNTDRTLRDHLAKICAMQLSTTYWRHVDTCNSCVSVVVPPWWCVPFKDTGEEL